MCRPDNLPGVFRCRTGLPQGGDESQHARHPPQLSKDLEIPSVPCLSPQFPMHGTPSHRVVHYEGGDQPNLPLADAGMSVIPVRVGERYRSDASNARSRPMALSISPASCRTIRFSSPNPAARDGSVKAGPILECQSSRSKMYRK